MNNEKTVRDWLMTLPELWDGKPCREPILSSMKVEIQDELRDNLVNALDGAFGALFPDQWAFIRDLKYAAKKGTFDPKPTTPPTDKQGEELEYENDHKSLYEASAQKIIELQEQINNLLSVIQSSTKKDDGLLKWLKDERNVLFNTACLMPNPTEYKNTMSVVDAINTTLQYIELSNKATISELDKESK